MIIVTGLGRCGTSFLMVFFKNIGIHIGKDQFCPIRRSGMEFAPFYAISRDVFVEYIERGKEVDLDEVRKDNRFWGPITLREQMSRVDNDRPKNQREFKFDLIPVFKDPRITWHPGVIRAWWEVRKDIKLIILHREPEKVVNSRKRCIERGGDDMIDPKRYNNPDEFKIDFCDFMTEVLRIGIPYRLFFYPNFLNEYDRIWQACNDFGMFFDKDKSRGVWEKTINRDYIT